MKKYSPNISVIIPAFNEENAIAKVIRDLPRSVIFEIIVVNNASTDRTREVAQKYGCRVIDEPQKGYGQACLTGIAALSDLTEIVVFIDGDHSDHAEKLPQLIKPIIEEGYEFVVGSRALGKREKGAMSPQAFYGNKLACLLMKWFWKASYTDLGPFRAVTFPALKKLKMSDKDYGWTIEMQIKALVQALKTKEIAVDYRRRIGKSKISGTVSGTIKAGFKIIWTILKYKTFSGTSAKNIFAKKVFTSIS